MHFIPESDTRNGKRNDIAVGTNYPNIFLPPRLQNYIFAVSNIQQRSVGGESDGCAMHASLSGDDST